MSDEILDMKIQVTQRDVKVAAAVAFISFFIWGSVGYQEGLDDAGVTRQVAVEYPLHEKTPEEMCRDLGYKDGFTMGNPVHSRDSLFELHCTNDYDEYDLFLYPDAFGENLTVTERSGGGSNR